MITKIMECDLVVLGAGGSGLVAANRAFDLTGKKVIVIEKAKKPAGCTYFASGMGEPVDLKFGPDGMLYYLSIYSGGYCGFTSSRRVAPGQTIFSVLLSHFGRMGKLPMPRKLSPSRFWRMKRGGGSPQVCLLPPAPDERWCWAASRRKQQNFLATDEHR